MTFSWFQLVRVSRNSIQKLILKELILTIGQSWVVPGANALGDRRRRQVQLRKPDADALAQCPKKLLLRRCDALANAPCFGQQPCERGHLASVKNIAKIDPRIRERLHRPTENAARCLRLQTNFD